MSRYHQARTVLHMLLVDAIFIVGFFTVCLYFYHIMYKMCFKRSICLIVFLYFLLLSMKMQVTSPASLSEEDRMELEKLKAELSDALQNYEDKELEEKNVVVQPKWTLATNGTTKAKNKVVVNSDIINEVETLRAELARAVTQDKYIAKVQSQASDSKQIKNLHKLFEQNMRGSKRLKEMVTGATHDKTVEEIVGGPAEDMVESKNGPKVIDSNAFSEPDIDLEQLQRLELSKRRNKEMLILESLEEDYSFNLGEDVQEWEHIMHDREEYFIGRRKTDLIIVKKNSATYEQAKILDIIQPIIYLETYSFWNHKQQQQEGVILVATENKVLWYKADGHNEEIRLCWEWVVGHPVSGLTYFSYQSNDFLAISAMASSRNGHFALNIYQFDLYNKEFWVVQRLQLDFPCEEVTMLDTGRDLVLAVPQNNTAAIYAFHAHRDSMDFIRFKFLMSVESEDVGLISAFQMGGRSYLAIGGRKPQILLYEHGTFVPKTVLGEHFGLVDFYFPIPVRTYRDDMLLLIQHRVDFETHSLTVLETLIWDGDSFEASIPVPCQMGDHKEFGVSCMLDIQRKEGLKGAALLRRDNEVSIIVPRNNAESGLFRLHTKLLSRNSEMLDLQEIFKFLQNWVKEQDDLIAKAMSFLNEPVSRSYTDETDMAELESLTTSELYFNGNIGEIYINDYIWTPEDTATDFGTIINSMELLEQSLNNRRYRRNVETVSSYDFLEASDVNAAELFIENLNNERFYVQNGELIFDGIINLQNLTVLDDSYVRERRQLEENSLKIIEDIEFTKINGISWQEFAENLVFLHEPLHLDTLNVEGEVIVEENFSLNELNKLNFPDDYLWTSGPATSIVKAQKTFTGKLTANAVDTNGIINGVNPMDAITLSNQQDWKGMPTFAQLEVSEKLQLNGTMQGLNSQELHTHPTLEESSVVTAACHFHRLKVLGTVYLNGSFDKKNISEFLLDVAQKPENLSEPIIINAQKTFSLINFPDDFHLKNSLIKNIPINQFLCKHTNDWFNTSILNGNIFFKNLTASAYDGVKIEELLHKSIKINETQHLASTQLNFANVIQAETINIKTSLNELPIAGYQTIEADLVVPEAYFEELQTETANIPNNIMGSASLNGINLQKFLQNHNWNNATSYGNIFLDELILADGLNADELHGLQPQFLFQFLEQIDDIPEMILAGKIQVDQVIVTGNVQIHTLNNLNFDEDVQLKAIWLNRPNDVYTNLSFLHPVLFKNNIHLMGNLNDQHFASLINDIIFRTDNQTAITATKIFKKDINVLGEGLFENIIGIPFENIAKKTQPNNFKGSLHITGNVITEEATFNSYLNDFPMHNLSKIIKTENGTQNFVVIGNHSITKQTLLKDLTVHGRIYDIPNLDVFLNELVFEKRGFLNGNYTFTGRVLIPDGAFIWQLNKLNLPNMFNNMIFVNDPNQLIVIDTPVKFMSNINAQEFRVQDSIKCRNLNGIALSDWIEDTLRADVQENITTNIQFSGGSLDNNKLTVNTVNGINLKRIITLNTAQNITEDLVFSEIYLDGHIASKGLINNVDLQQEYDNTLLLHGNQHISTPLELSTMEVFQNLYINGTVNDDKNLNHVATLQGTQVFQTPIFFKDIYTIDVETNYTISGINVNEWYTKSILLNERPEHLITGNWSARKLVVKQGPQLPIFIIDGLTNEQYNDYSRTVRNAREYEELWSRTKLLKEQIQKRSHPIKYAESIFEINLFDANADIKKAVILKEFLIINSHNTSFIYKLNLKQRQLDELAILPIAALGETLLLSENKNSTTILLHNLQDDTINVYEIHNKKVTLQQKFSIHAKDLLNLYVTYQQNLMKVCLEHGNVTELFKLQGTYRFMALTDSGEVNFCNGTNIILLNHFENIEKFNLPVYETSFADSDVQESSLYGYNINSSKLLELRSSRTRLLNELKQRLQQEILITQLSIPETDLLDEHLAMQFAANMQALIDLQIFANSTLAAINQALLHELEHPAEILAARAVHLVWKYIMEVKQLENQTNSEEQPAESVLQLFGAVIHDMLLSAFNTTVTDNYEKLLRVIEHLHHLDAQLHDIMHKNIAQNQENSNDQKTMLCNANSEFLKLTMNSQTLLAVSNKNYDNITLFSNVLKGELFQNIIAQKPHALVTLRIDNEQIFAFVENCCTVRMLIYRGVKGFVDLISFQTEFTVRDLISLNINEKIYYFAIVLPKKIVFYKIFV